MDHWNGGRAGRPSLSCRLLRGGAKFWAPGCVAGPGEGRQKRFPRLRNTMNKDLEDTVGGWGAVRMGIPDALRV